MLYEGAIGVRVTLEPSSWTADGHLTCLHMTEEGWWWCVCVCVMSVHP